MYCQVIGHKTGGNKRRKQDKVRNADRIGSSTPQNLAYRGVEDWFGYYFQTVESHKSVAYYKFIDKKPRIVYNTIYKREARAGNAGKDFQGSSGILKASR